MEEYKTSENNQGYMEMKETSTDYIPSGYIEDGLNEQETPKKIGDCARCGRDLFMGQWLNLDRNHKLIHLYARDCEPFKLTEEAYQWLISLCCRGQA